MFCESTTSWSKKIGTNIIQVFHKNIIVKLRRHESWLWRRYVQGPRSKATFWGSIDYIIITEISTKINLYLILILGTLKLLLPCSLVGENKFIFVMAGYVITGVDRKFFLNLIASSKCPLCNRLLICIVHGSIYLSTNT